MLRPGLVAKKNPLEIYERAATLEEEHVKPLAYERSFAQMMTASSTRLRR